MRGAPIPSLTKSAEVQHVEEKQRGENDHAPQPLDDAEREPIRKGSSSSSVGLAPTIDASGYRMTATPSPTIATKKIGNKRSNHILPIEMHWRPGSGS